MATAHRGITGEDLHALARVASADPGAIGAAKGWLDSDDNVLRIRNAADSAWIILATGTIITDHGGLGGLSDDDHPQYVLKSLVDAKGDLLVGSAADTLIRLAVGTNGHVLTADSAETSGVKWAATSGGVLTDHTHEASGSGATGGGSVLKPTGGFVFPKTTTPAQTTEGEAVWDTDSDVLTIGDGTSRKTFYPLLEPSVSGNRWGVTPQVGADGVLEVGRYIDFHNSDGSTGDSDVRLETNATTTDLYIDNNIIYRAGGTDIPVTDGGTGASTAGVGASGTNALGNIGIVTATGSTASLSAGSGTDIVITWPKTLPSTNYKVFLSFMYPASETTNRTPPTGYVKRDTGNAPTTTDITVRVLNNAAVAEVVTVVAMAVLD